MSKPVLLHNPRCRKSREAIALLEEKGLAFVVREYLKEPLSLSEVDSLLSALGIDALSLMRKKEKLFIELKIEELTEVQRRKALSENPKLMERPILWWKKRAAIGRPAEQLLIIL
jgi:arsenate reductase